MDLIWDCSARYGYACRLYDCESSSNRESRFAFTWYISPHFSRDSRSVSPAVPTTTPSSQAIVTRCASERAGQPVLGSGRWSWRDHAVISRTSFLRVCRWGVCRSVVSGLLCSRHWRSYGRHVGCCGCCCYAIPRRAWAMVE